MKGRESKFDIDYYNYHLPVERIAPKPACERSASRLLVLDKKNGDFIDSSFKDLGGFLKNGDMLVFNDSKVIKARLFGKKENGSRVEIFLLAPFDRNEKTYEISKCIWVCLLRQGRSLKIGALIDLGAAAGKIEEILENGKALISFTRTTGEPLNMPKYLEEFGEVPLPPYIHRRRKLTDYQCDPFIDDCDRYQTIYAKNPGSVAAPTAGLHFEKGFMEELKAKGIEISYVTLHVGLGTFKPIKARDIRDHQMESEWYSIDADTYTRISDAKKARRRIIAVGTTSVRVIESVFQNKEVRLSGWTQLFITPGFDFKIVDSMITNFHLPGSTLMLLVSALAGRDRIMKAYMHAIEAKYRFYSYGDAMLII